MNKCTQCQKEMNPVDWIISHVCLSCARKNHSAVIGIYNKKSEKGKRDFIASCFALSQKAFTVTN